MVVAPKTVLARLVVAVALQTFGSAVGVAWRSAFDLAVTSGL